MFSTGSILFWIILCVLVGILANSRNRSFFAYFLISLILSPLIGLLTILIIGQKKNKEGEAKIINVNNIEKKEISKILKNETYFVKIKNYETNDFKVFKESLLTQYKEKGYTNIIRDEESLWNLKNVNYLNSYIQLKLKDNDLVLEAYNVPFEPGIPEEIIPKEENKETSDSSEKLIQLSKLLEKGLLTEEEFIGEKKKILNYPR